MKPGSSPVFGAPKSESGKRKLDISEDMAKLLVAHRKHQAELKMRYRDSYRDHGLVFAKESGSALGDPLQMNNLGQREFAKLVEEAGIRPIKFHGLRHTNATLALSAGVPSKVVSQRLGHGRTEVTMNIYAHALPSAQKEAAAKMASLLR
jgi:integrase